MSVHRPILVPLDGSDLAEHAVPVAAALARRAGGELRLLHVHDPMAAQPIHVKGLPVIDDRMRSLRREHERAYLEGVPQRLAPGASVSAHLLDAPVAAAILGYAERNDAALIVLTSHARSGFERAWLGSVTDELVRRSRVPLLVLRPEPGQLPGPLRRILVPLDGSAAAESILEHAAWLARLEADAELVLLEVVQPVASALGMPGAPVTASPSAEDPAGHPEATGAREYLDGVVRRLEASGVRARARVEVAAVVAPAVLEIAREERADVVALATHGRSGLERLMLGSVADKVIRGSHTPILVFRPSLPTAGGTVGGNKRGEP